MFSWPAIGKLACSTLFVNLQTFVVSSQENPWQSNSSLFKQSIEQVSLDLKCLLQWVTKCGYNNKNIHSSHCRVNCAYPFNRIVLHLSKFIFLNYYFTRNRRKQNYLTKKDVYDTFAKHDLSPLDTKKQWDNLGAELPQYRVVPFIANIL